MEGFSSDNITSLSSTISSSATSALGDIKMEGFNPDNVSHITEGIKTGANLGMSNLTAISKVDTPSGSGAIRLASKISVIEAK